METTKTKAIRAHLDTFMHTPAYQKYSSIFSHIQTYSDMIKHIEEIFTHIQAYLEPCVTLKYSEPWYIQNP